ncbi:MAG TPA: hypothetical protein VFU43_21185 [Streptosporangiaceae bacterium]|nr:hypothetical protein [Streptosporangiaceae bacterium]
MTFPAENRTLPSPQDMARHLQHRHRAWWLIWYGAQTRQYWALALWVHTPYALLSAATPEALDAAIATFHSLHPNTRPQYAHAVDHRSI